MTKESLADTLGTKAVQVGNFESGSQEWHDIRAHGIGGSEVGSILGLNPYQSPFTTWAKKTGRIEESFTQNEAMEWGTRLESVILDKFADEHTELTLHRNVGSWSHPERSWQLANPDAIYERVIDTPGGPLSRFGIVEVKTSQFEDTWRDSETGEPAVPPHYLAQVLWYCQVFGYTEPAYVIALFHGNRYREFEVKPDTFVMDANLARVEEFQRLIVDDVQPDYDGALSTYTTVRQLHPKIEDGEVELGWLGVEYFSADKKYREAESELLEVKSRILDAMAFSKRGLVQGDWTFTRQARGAGDPFLVVKRG